MTRKETRSRVVGFAPAVPGWRLWIVGPRGEPVEVALAGWVTVAEVEVESEPWGDETETATGYRSIHPGWVCEGHVTTTEDSYGEDCDTWAIGPGDHWPSPEELAVWAKRHRESRERLEQMRRERLQQQVAR